MFGTFRNVLAVMPVFLASLAYLMLFRSYGFQVEDEGTLLFHLDRAARGLLPYTDFHTGYTPGYFWIGSNLLEWVGRSTTGLRTLLAIANAASATLLYVIARDRAPTLLALLAPLAWLGFIPVFRGSFAMFNVPYPAWLATLFWLVVAAGLLSWEHRRRLASLVVCGAVVSLAFSIKLNAGAYAAAACVWVIVATTRSETWFDRAAGITGTLIVGLGVWLAFGLRTWGIDAGVHLLPLVAIVAFALWKVRGRFADATDVGALRALLVLSASFLPLTLVWAVPTIGRLGVDRFASEVLLLGSNAAEIYWIDHPAVEMYAFAAAIGVLGFAGVGRLLAHRVIPLTAAVGAVVVGVMGTVAVALTAGIMPEGRAVSIVRQLENASFWLAPLVHWGMFVLLATRIARGIDEARLWVLGVCSVAMYWQLYPRTDFSHIMFAVPLCIPLALWLLTEVLGWWARASDRADALGRLTWGAASIGAAIGAIPVALALAAPIHAWGVPTQTGNASRVAVHVERDRSDELVGFGEAVNFLGENTNSGEPVLAFPALAGLTYAAGLTNPVEHDYWYPQRPDHAAEARMLAIVREAPPRFVATINTGWTFFFDSPAYFAEARTWVADNYRLVRRFDRIDILARNDVLTSEPTLLGGLPWSDTDESEPPAHTDYVRRLQEIRAWADTLPQGRYLEGLLSADTATALRQLRGIRDAGDLRTAAVLFTGYESSNDRVAREAIAAATKVVQRHDASVHRWAADLDAGDYAPYLAPMLERARRHRDSLDEGMRDLSNLIVRVVAEGQGS